VAIANNKLGPVGPQGPQGEVGPQGPQGERGESGFISSIIGEYRIDANTVGGDPAAGHIRYDNATQTSALNLTIDHESINGIDVDIFLELLGIGSALVIQDKDEHLNNQIWEITGTPVHTGPTYWTFPVTLRSSAGTGTTGFVNNLRVFLAAFGGGGASTETADIASFTQFGGLN
jgi:hypothetical protein